MAGKGGGTSTVNVTSGPVTVDADSTVDIQGLNDIKVTLQPSPFKTESTNELILPQPLKTESKLDSSASVTSDSKSALSVDLKPVALDVCLNTSTKLPQGEICQPFSLHFGVTWFGLEMLGFNLGGESRTVFQDLPKRPAVAWAAQQNVNEQAAETFRDRDRPVEQGRGLRIRIK